MSQVAYSSFCLLCVSYLTLLGEKEASQQNITCNGETNLSSESET